MNFLKKYEKSLEKIYKKANIVSPFNKNTYLDFYNYLKHREEIIFSLTIGDSFSNNGISIEICENDSVFREFNYTSPAINNSSIGNSSFKSYNDSIIDFPKKKNIVQISAKQIFILHIPFLLFKMSDSLFKNFKQLWVSDIHCKNTNGEKDFEKVKIKFYSNASITSNLNFSTLEVLFCNQLMKSLEFNLIDNEDQEEINFIAVFPFDKSLKSSPKVKLNNAFTQMSFYYEDHDKLRKFYTNNSKLITTKRLSFFYLFVKEITFKVFLPTNSLLFNMINQMVNITKYLDNTDKNKFKLNEEVSEINGYNNAKEKKFVLIKEKLSLQQINIILKKLNIKIYNNRINNHNNFMVILNINKIKYKENMEENNKENCCLSNLSLKSINVILSIPNKFRDKESKEVQPSIKSKDYTNIHKRMSEEENQLIVLSLEKLSLRVVKIPNIEIEFVVQNTIRLGFLKRKNFHFSVSNMDLDNMNLIFWIDSAKSNKNLNEKYQNDVINISNLSNESSSNIKLDDIERNRLKDNAQNRYDINNEFSLKLSLLLKPSGNEEPNGEELFPHLKRMINEFQRLISLKYQSRLKLSLNNVNIQIPNSLFNYIYYFKNFLKILEENFIDKVEIPEINQVNEDFLNEFINEYKLIRNHKFSKNDLMTDLLSNSFLFQTIQK